MATTPLRALRVPDELWRAAQTRAAACGETVSEVVRRGLAEYVALGDLELAAQVASRPTASMTQPDAEAVVLLAQGMVMVRLGLDAESAAAHLRELAGTWEATLEEAARSVVAASVPAGPVDRT